MSAALPAQIDPWQAVVREAAFAGSLALTDLPRLSEVLASAAPAPARFEIAFGRDEAGRPVVLGRVRAVLPLECQRCLGVMEHSVDVAIHLMLVPGPEPTQDPPEPYEPLAVVDDRVRPAALIEDELLLALPQIPKHPPGACRPAVTSAGPPGADAGPESAAAATDRPRPFALLAGWKADP
jgi:uncharacterized protein